ncbi:MAG TPA: aldehyde dehydrogenase (NADP(+)) [Tepidisphaeraceae bacterium]|nr:aldehyde dehydrogenase (NADP(+)) [Tepidisphaeraceae bacterium]
MSAHQVLIAGQWKSANSLASFHAENPATGEKLAEEFPISKWADCDAALSAAVDAAALLRKIPAEMISRFLRTYADRIEANASKLVEAAHLETALPKSPRLAEVELPRTTTQLRQAADAAFEGSWSQPTIDSKQNIRSYLAPIGPVCILGPNNFPFAFNGISGGDFAAAIAAGNPAIVKAHPSHPQTTRLLAEEVVIALKESGLPPATVQLLYHMSNEDGLKLVSDPRTGAIAFTGSRRGGLALKAAADVAGKPIYLEMSSVNPTVILPGALAERFEKIADEFAGSCLMGSGQFCTNPGFVILLAGQSTDGFIAAIKQRFEKAPSAPLLGPGVHKSLITGIQLLQQAGAKLVTGGSAVSAPGYRFQNTLLRVDGAQFLREPKRLQSEAFGNASLFVVAHDIAEAKLIVDRLEGNLTGCVYSSTDGSDDPLYDQIAPSLRIRVGRMLNDKMPTGVALSPAMNHGGPYPSTGHAGFTAVGIPASMRRFGMLYCFDGVRAERLPPLLRDKNPNGRCWRMIDGRWTQQDVGMV